MLNLLRILVIFLGLFGGGILVSILWPRITPQKPPSEVEKVREALKGTEVGQKIFAVLGEKSFNSNHQESSFPQNLKITHPLEVAKEKLEKFGSEKSAEQIIRILGTLPKEEQKELKKQFCPPF